MNPQSDSISRRHFLAVTAAASAGTLLGGCASLQGSSVEEQAKKITPVSFFFVSDTHYLADKNNPTELDPRSRQLNSRLVDHLNRLPGTDIPEAAGGGKVAPPLGVLHGGDLTDSADKNIAPFLQMQQTELASFVAEFGLTGKDGRLRYPVYEVHGNHDGATSKGQVVSTIIERNQKRPGLRQVSANGLHYSWDWGQVHFINLGIVVGSMKKTRRPRRYNPWESLDFLISDLEKEVGQSGRPVVVTHHVDVARNCFPCDPAAATSNKEWDPCDVDGFFQALQGYNVAAIFYGHTHRRSFFRWDGTATPAQAGLPVFNVDNSAHYNLDDQSFYYVQITGEEVVIGECTTTNDWQTLEWTPQVWKSGLKANKSPA